MRPLAWLKCHLFITVLGALGVAGAHAGVDVEVEGIDSPLKDNVEVTLSIARLEDDAPESAVRKTHNRAEREIRTALEPFGYYLPVIQVALEGSEGEWKARYSIDPGPQFQVSKVDVQLTGEGSSDSLFAQLVTDFPVVENEALDHARYESGKKKLLDYAARHGYFDAEIDSSSIRVSLEAQSAEILVHIDSGRRYQFGAVTLNQDVLEDRMVEGYVTTEPGDPWDVAPLLEMQTGLSSGPWFAAVEVNSQPENADSLAVPVEVDLIPAKTQKWELGLGYGTDTGVRGTVASQWRRLNRRGHHAEAELMASAIEYSASAQYFIPWPYPDTRQLTFFAGVGKFDPSWSESWRVAVGSNFALSRGSWREVWSLAWEYEDFVVADQEGVSRLLIPGVSWTRTRADDALIPSKGNRIRFDLRGAHDALLSSTSFAQAWLEIKAIRSLHSRVRIIGRATGARTFTDEFSALPPTHRFVTGGDNTIRGYGYETLGPENSEGAIIGGNSLAVFSGELEYRFAASWGVAGFADTGNALDDFQGDLALGTGIGIRWFSPIGVVRLDGAIGLDDPGDPVRVHLSIGPDF